MVELTVHIHQMIGSVGQSSLDHKGAFPSPFSTLKILSFVSRGRIVFHTLFPSSANSGSLLSPYLEAAVITFYLLKGYRIPLTNY